MTYEEIVYTIDNKRRFGKACGRDVTLEFMEALGHPEFGMHIIHIAGTNGKGSVAAFTSSILRAASFNEENHISKVGLFTSPHLTDYTERIQINGVQIAKEDVTRIGEKLLGYNLKLEPTMFDYWLAMALIYFKEQGVDYVVLETGLGGAKDSTNGLAQPPVVCGITSIGLEHTQFLGDTLSAIAGEKAGIIKPGVPVVIGQMEQEASDVIVSKAVEIGCEYTFAGSIGSDVELGLFGGYQRNNAATAVEMIKCLNLDIDDEVIARGLRDARWPGRMQIISASPFIMLDGAHNPNGVQALFESLQDSFPDEKFSFIMAVMADKDYLEMAQIVGPVAKRFFAVSVSDYSRALQSAELAKAINGLGFEAKSFDDYHEAISEAGNFDEKIIIFGSLYFIGEVLDDQNKGRGL